MNRKAKIEWKKDWSNPQWLTEDGTVLRLATSAEWETAQSTQTFEWTVKMVLKTGPLSNIKWEPE